jgi:nucleolar protein 58
LASAISEELGLECGSDEKTVEIMRGIRSQLNSLLKGISETDFKAMSLGLAHSISRYRLKFSAEKVDVMIIQAISLLDDLDKELNNYSMRLKEWYSWHFPELVELVSDYLLYAKVVYRIGFKAKIKDTVLNDLVPEDIEKEIREAAEMSMGTEISPDDETHIKDLANQVTEMYEYRESLSNYLKARMTAVAPNLSQMVGEIVGSRLIAKAGSLVNLAKLPSSTVQILGAEKALFKAMRTKHNTPKYGLIYHASLVGAAPASIKGKVSRSLAAKCALCIRYDALGESLDGSFGVANKAYIEAKIKQLESVIGKTPAPGKPVQKYKAPTQGAKEYNVGSDFPAAE